MNGKLVTVGDLHLGRMPSRLPEELAGQARELGPAGAWRRIVDRAIEEGVHVLALAGDVVEEEYDFFEAYRELQSGVERLVAAGIAVRAVAGNHDVQVLPRLADQVEDFKLLGRDGVWEQETLSAGDEQLTVHGWSFPQRTVRISPLAGHQFERGSGLNLGLLHCDRDQSGSSYGPVTSAELSAADLDGWLLGHIHKPDSLSVENPVGYLGSATGLSSGEPGKRGPWLFTIEGGRLVSVEHWSLAPVRWERLAVDLTGIEAAEDARERLLEAINGLDTELSASSSPPEAVGLRVTFTGRTDRRRSVQTLLDAENLDALPAGGGHIHYFAERIRHATRPDLDMQALAQRTDPPGLLARRLLVLGREPDDAERCAMIEDARRHLADQAGQRYWQSLDGATTDDDEAIADWLQQAGLAALDRLLAQREAAE